MQQYVLNQMEEIILSTNINPKKDLSKMTDDAKAFEVAQCLKNVKRLKLNCWIKKHGAAMLSSAIENLPEAVRNMEKLFLASTS